MDIQAKNFAELIETANGDTELAREAISQTDGDPISAKIYIEHETGEGQRKASNVKLAQTVESIAGSVTLGFSIGGESVGTITLSGDGVARLDFFTWDIIGGESIIKGVIPSETTLTVNDDIMQSSVDMLDLAQRVKYEIESMVESLVINGESGSLMLAWFCSDL